MLAYNTNGELDINQGFWLNLRELLVQEFGDVVFRNWISHLSLVELKDKTVVLSSPSRFIREWVLNNYKGVMELIVRSISPNLENIDIIVVENQNAFTPDKLVNANENKIIESAKINSALSCEITDLKLDEKLSFENFIVGNSNRVAFTAVKTIAQGQSLPVNANIVYLYSNVGMGKTHLLQATANFISKADKSKKVVYLSAEKFMHLYIKSVKNNSLVDFKESLRTADILLIDDLQFICGKTGTQQEFANIVNALTESSKKVILAADCSPYNLNLDSRTVSRLSGGLVVDIKVPDLELRKQILKAKSAQNNCNISEEVINFLAEKLTASVRDLEGAINKLATYCFLEARDADMFAVNEILKDSLAASNVEISIDLILEKVAKFYGIKPQDITSKSRSSNFVKARQVTAYIAKNKTTKSLSDIGFKLGGRDHATVIYCVKKIEDMIQSGDQIVGEIARITDLILN